MAFFWHIVAIICMQAPNIFGYNLILGKAKIFHFGPIGTSVIAAYGTFVPLMYGYSYPVSLLIGAALTAVASLFFAWLSLRLSPDAFGVMSIAVHLSMLAVVLNWATLTRGALGIPQIPRFFFLHTTAQFAIFSFIVALLTLFCLHFVYHGSFGRKIDALAEHQWHAKSLGINRVRVHVILFLIGGLCALITNVLYHQYLFLVHPSDFGYPVLTFFVMIVVAGKPGSLQGVVLSVVLLTLLREGIRFLPISAALLGPLRLILFGVILFVAVWVRRDTLFPKQRSV
jgi:branched-chain amino acid transport system permease protein